MKLKNKLIWIFTSIIILFVACNDDDDFGPSVFKDDPGISVDSKLYSFEMWLDHYYLTPYNLDFRYRMQDAGSNTDLNLVPATLENSKDLAIALKYMWFGAYEAMTEKEDPNFLKLYAPRIIHIIGSDAYNTNGDPIMGSADNGIKISLYNVNKFDYKDIARLDTVYFQTMHREFINILRQKRSVPREFEAFSKDFYDPTNWSRDSLHLYAPKGFVTKYARSQTNADFAEVIATYIVRAPEWWDTTLKDNAVVTMPNGTVDSTGWVIINNKVAMCKNWMKTAWNIELDSLRKEVIRLRPDFEKAIEDGRLEIENYGK